MSRSEYVMSLLEAYRLYSTKELLADVASIIAEIDALPPGKEKTLRLLTEQERCVFIEYSEYTTDAGSSSKKCLVKTDTIRAFYIKIIERDDERRLELRKKTR